MESFEQHTFPYKIKSVQFLQDRNLLCFQFPTQIQIYRLFELVHTIQTDQHVLFTNDHFVIVHRDGLLDFYSLESGNKVMSNRINLDQEQVLKARFHPQSKLLTLETDKRLVVTNFYFVLIELNIISKIVHQIPNSFQFLVIDDRQSKIYDFSAIEKDLEFLDVVSGQRQSLLRELESLQSFFKKYSVEVTNIKSTLKSIDDKLTCAFEEHITPPTRIHWKRLVCMGDVDHDIITTLTTFEKPLMSIQKSLNASLFKCKNFKYQMLDCVDTILTCFESLSQANRVLSKSVNSPSFITNWSNEMLIKTDAVEKVLLGRIEFVTFVLDAIRLRANEGKQAMEVYDTDAWFEDIDGDMELLEGECNVFQESLFPFQELRLGIDGACLGCVHDQDSAYLVYRDGLIVKVASGYLGYARLEFKGTVNAIGHDGGRLLLLSSSTTDSIKSIGLDDIAFQESIGDAIYELEDVWEFEKRVLDMQVNKGVVCVVYEDGKSIELFDLE
jgi:hypothetical protein